MPSDTHSKPLQHPPSTTAVERVQHRFVVSRGTSPFYPDEKAQPVDRSQIVGCPVCHRRFLNETFLERHQKDYAKPKPAKTTAEEIAAAVERVVETITGRIGSGELRLGDAIKQSSLADELGYPRTRVEAAVAQLVERGRLEYSGVGSARRALVV